MLSKKGPNDIFLSRLESLGRKNNDKEILKNFSPEEKDLISKRKRVLSSIVYFIGKDFEMPVELNNPGAGWHWDFKKNEVKVDPQDLLNKPEGFSRFVMGHEAGHRRISRTGFIPLEIWKKPGFAFMMNSIEDPRDNNFVAEGYPKFAEDMTAGYEWIKDLEEQSSKKAEQKLGYQPRFKQAGFEYIRQWWREINKKESDTEVELPVEVKEVVDKTLSSARDSWWTYPTKKEADTAEANIEKYAYVSYKINYDKIWPEFEKLVKMDMEDQKMQEFMKDMQGEKMQSENSGGDGGLPKEIKDQLTSEEQEELEKAIEEAVRKFQGASSKGQGEIKNKEDKEDSIDKSDEKESAESSKGEEGQSEQGLSSNDQDLSESQNEDGKGDKQDGLDKSKPIDLDSLSDSLKKKIKDFIDSMPADQKKELEKRASKEIGDFGQELADNLQGEMTENPVEKTERESGKKDGHDKDEGKKPDAGDPKKQKDRTEKKESKEVREFREMIEKDLKKDANVYEEKRREVLPIIDKLENDLRDIFIKRRAGSWESGFKYGKRIDIKKRIQEKAKGVSAVESKAWQKKEAPGEKDYAISILNDLSGSMGGDKIEMDFKAKIVLAEVLNKLSIKCEILGFNDRIYEYQKFEQPMGNDIREKMGGMLEEVNDFEGGKAKYNDDGWALGKASERLAKVRAKQKFLIVLSDGHPEESDEHSGEEFDLKKVVETITKNTNQKLIGLGIMTKSVSDYYPTAIEDVELEDMIDELADLIRDIVVNYEKY